MINEYHSKFLLEKQTSQANKIQSIDGKYEKMPSSFIMQQAMKKELKDQ